MSKARPVIPGATLFVTRRCHKRQFLLRPSRRLNHVIEYIVAVLAERYGILVHCLCVMSNHMHDVVTDPHGNIVEFRRDLHALLARHINAIFGEFESIWSREPTSRIECADPATIVENYSYTLANPVEARLVEHGHSWPGVRRAWPAKPRTIRRPPGFFRHEDDGGRWPAEVTLTLHRPPGHDQLSDDQLAAVLRDAVRKREDEHRQIARRENRRFLGRRTILAQSRHGYPASAEARFGLRPEVAGRWKWARLEALQRRKEWVEQYEAALKELRAGNRDVVFPYGTYKLRSYYRIGCGPPRPA